MCHCFFAVFFGAAFLLADLADLAVVAFFADFFAAAFFVPVFFVPFFAAGFLFGYTQNKPLIECARLGNQSAAHIIQQLGARPLKPLKESIAA